MKYLHGRRATVSLSLGFWKGLMKRSMSKVICCCVSMWGKWETDTGESLKAYRSVSLAHSREKARDPVSDKD